MQCPKFHKTLKILKLLFRGKLLNFVLKNAVQFSLLKGGRLHKSESIPSSFIEISPVFFSGKTVRLIESVLK